MSILRTEVLPFKATAFKDGDFINISEADLHGKWSVVFFYPADFTFVCPTELEDLAEHYEEFQKRGVEIYSVSTDTHFTHMAWHGSSPAVGKVRFPMVGDPTGVICRNFGVMIEEAGLAERGTFVINPEGKIVACEIHDGGIGRDAAELLRKPLVEVFQIGKPAGEADVQQRQVGTEQELPRFFAAQLAHIGLKGQTKGGFEKSGEISHGQPQFTGQIGEKQLFRVVAVDVGADGPNALGPVGGALPLLLRDAAGGSRLQQLLKKQADQPGTAQGGVLLRGEICAGDLQKGCGQRRNFIAARSGGEGKFYIFHLGKNAGEESRGDLKGQDQGGPLRDELVALKGVNDPETAGGEGAAGAGGQQLHGAVQKQAHLKLRVHMRRAVEQVVQEYIIVHVSMGDHFKFLAHWLHHL